MMLWQFAAKRIFHWFEGCVDGGSEFDMPRTPQSYIDFGSHSLRHKNTIKTIIYNKFLLKNYPLR